MATAHTDCAKMIKYMRKIVITSYDHITIHNYASLVLRVGQSSNRRFSLINMTKQRRFSTAHCVYKMNHVVLLHTRDRLCGLLLNPSYHICIVVECTVIPRVILDALSMTDGFYITGVGSIL